MKLKIQRFNPETGGEPEFREYTVDAVVAGVGDHHQAVLTRAETPGLGEASEVVAVATEGVDLTLGAEAQHAATGVVGQFLEEANIGVGTERGEVGPRHLHHELEPAERLDPRAPRLDVHEAHRRTAGRIVGAAGSIRSSSIRWPGEAVRAPRLG